METSFNNTNTSGNPSRKNTAAPISGSSTVSPGSSQKNSDMKKMSGDQVMSQVNTIVDRVKNIDYQKQLSTIRDQYDVAYDASSSAIRTNPVTYVLGAAILGFFVGSIWNRRES